MKKRSAISFLLLIAIFLTLTTNSVTASTLGEDLSVVSGCRSIDAQVPMLQAEEPITNVMSAFLYDNTNDVLLYAYNADEQLDPASLVKTLTALIIAEQGNMEEEITVREDVINTLPENALGVDLQPGETIRMEDLLYCTIVSSANDAAVVAADRIYGSQAAFVNEMNKYAQRLGCKNTNFTNVTGLYDTEQYSTARDLARILAAASQNEIFMEAFSTVNYTVPATNLSEARELSSSNYLMNDDMMIIYLDSRVTGGRAGVMDTGERNLAATAERNDVELVSIVLGSQSVFAENGYTVLEFGSFKETSQLLDMGFKGHHTVQLFYADQALKQYVVNNGDSYVSTGIRNDITALLPYGVTYEDLEYRYNEDTTTITAPVKKGDAISSVQIWYEGICLAHADLYALHDVNVAETIVNNTPEDNEREDGPSILIPVIVITVLLLALLFGRKFVFRLIHKRRVRRHNKHRRRSR